MKNQRLSASDFLMQNDAFNQTPVKPMGAGTFDMAAEAAGLTPEQQKARRTRKEGGISFITLNSGRRVQFESVYIPAERVSSETVVHEFNLRTQEAVTLEMIEDILPSIQKAGVKMPALATRDQDDVLHVFDGSRRRFAAINAGCGLYVDVTDETLSDDEIAELSHVTNLTKISSLYDRGRYYQLQKEKYPELSQNELAAQIGIASSALGYALQAYEVPLPIYQIFPSKTELGRTQTQTLYKLTKSLSDDELDALIATCQDADLQSSDKEAMEFIKAAVSVSPATQTDKTEAIGKIRVKAKGTKLQIEAPDEATLEEIYQLLQNKYL